MPYAICYLHGIWHHQRARGCLIALVGQHSVLTLNYIILAKTRKICGVLYIDTSYNPQNLRNIIKKVAKISIVQVIHYRTCLSKQPYFATFFDILIYATNFTGLG